MRTLYAILSFPLKQELTEFNGCERDKTDLAIYETTLRLTRARSPARQTNSGFLTDYEKVDSYHIKKAPVCVEFGFRERKG